MHDEHEDAGVNPTDNPTFDAAVVARFSRRRLLQGGLATAALSMLGRPATPAAAAPSLLGFKSVPVSTGSLRYSLPHPQFPACAVIPHGPSSQPSFATVYWCAAAAI